MVAPTGIPRCNIADFTDLRPGQQGNPTSIRPCSATIRPYSDPIRPNPTYGQSFFLKREDRRPEGRIQSGLNPSYSDLIRPNPT